MNVYQAETSITVAQVPQIYLVIVIGGSFQVIQQHRVAVNQREHAQPDTRKLQVASVSSIEILNTVAQGLQIFLATANGGNFLAMKIIPKRREVSLQMAALLESRRRLRASVSSIGILTTAAQGLQICLATAKGGDFLATHDGRSHCKPSGKWQGILTIFDFSKREVYFSDLIS